jgi:lipopolysaccharide export system protein LptC
MLQIPGRKYFIPLFLLALTLLSVWLFQGQPEKGRSVTVQSQGAPDSFMENFTTRTMDAAGRPQYQLSATRMAHYAEDNHSELTQPRFTAFRADGEQWTVVAESGQATAGAKQILLNGAVTIERHPDATAPANLQILTRDVRVRPADDYAETDAATTIVHGTGAQQATLNSLGMQVDFGEGRLLLLSQVRGNYVP